MNSRSVITSVCPGACCGPFLALLLHSLHADQFEFSYVVDNGTTIAGTLEGTVSGRYVTDVSNVSLTINGNSVGPVDVWGYFAEAAYEISFDSRLNNFWFGEAGAWSPHSQTGDDGRYGFALIGSTITTPKANQWGNDYDWVFDLARGVPKTQFPGHQMNGSWSLTRVAEAVEIRMIAKSAEGVILQIESNTGNVDVYRASDLQDFGDEPIAADIAPGIEVLVDPEPLSGRAFYLIVPHGSPAP